MQNHLALTYCNVQPSPMALNVMVPDPDVFHPALATVITMSPDCSYMTNVLICPLAPAAKVAVSLVTVLK